MKAIINFLEEPLRNTSWIPQHLHSCLVLLLYPFPLISCCNSYLRVGGSVLELSPAYAGGNGAIPDRRTKSARPTSLSLGRQLNTEPEICCCPAYVYLEQLSTSEYCI